MLMILASIGIGIVAAVLGVIAIGLAVNHGFSVILTFIAVSLSICAIASFWVPGWISVITVIILAVIFFMVGNKDSKRLL